ncbi:hypothetical protein MRX96_047016 [Rhipicephalus microplus]
MLAPAHAVHAQGLGGILQLRSRTDMGDHCQRPRLVPHSVCFRPRRPLFHGRRQHPPPGFDELMGAAYLQEQFGLPSTFAWTPGPTLSTEPVPKYHGGRVRARTSLGTAPYHVRQRGRSSIRRRSQSPAEQGTEAVRFPATRARTRKSVTPSTRETLRSNPSKEEQEEYIEVVLSRLLRTVADFGLGMPAKKEVPRFTAHKFNYSAAIFRSLNVHSWASMPASGMEHQDLKKTFVINQSRSRIRARSKTLQVDALVWRR